MKTTNLNVAKHYHALVMAEQKLYIFKTIKMAFAWQSLNKNDPGEFFLSILTYLEEVNTSEELPQDLKDWAKRLHTSYQIEFSIFNESQTNN